MDGSQREEVMEQVVDLDRISCSRVVNQPGLRPVYSWLVQEEIWSHSSNVELSKDVSC